jgi:hypothetical protein
MVINNFNIVGIIIFPAEADTPLFINAYAVLAFAITSQGLQTVSRWNLQVI